MGPPSPWGGGGFEGALATKKTGAGTTALGSGGEAVPAVTSVGVDIEFIQPDLVTSQWTAHVMTQEEAECINCKGPEEFFRLWTRKEAVAKSLNCEGITLDDFGSFSVLQDQVELLGHQIEVRSFETDPGYATAVAWVTAPA